MPRLLNRIVDKIQNTANAGSALKRALFAKAVASKLENMDKTGSVTHTFWDKLVFNKVKAALGGRVRVIISGSAPISADTKRFLRIAFCCQVVEGYGQTEGTACCTVMYNLDYSPNNVGAPSCW